MYDDFSLIRLRDNMSIDLKKGEVMKFIISEHIYIYHLHIRLCCMFILGYTVLSWSSFSSTGVLNLMFL